MLQCRRDSNGVQTAGDAEDRQNHEAGDRIDAAGHQEDHDCVAGPLAEVAQCAGGPIELSDGTTLDRRYGQGVVSGVHRGHDDGRFRLWPHLQKPALVNESRVEVGKAAKHAEEDDGEEREVLGVGGQGVDALLVRRGVAAEVDRAGDARANGAGEN